MKAFVVEKWCEPEEMVFTEMEDPNPGDDEILIDTKAIGINFPDLLLIQGKYQTRPKRPFVPGAEVAGVVAKIGKNIKKFKIGDRVSAITWLGGYADKAISTEKHTYLMPDSMSFEEGAGFHVIYQSSYFGVVERAKLQAGETLLVHAGAGGIGTSSIQIGKALGARVIATAGSDEKLEIAKKCGADIVLNYNDATWSKKIRKEYGGVDVVIDPVGGDVLQKSLLCTNFEGRIVVVGFTSGKIAEVASNMLLLNNISLVGLFWNLYAQNHLDRIEKAVDTLHGWFVEGKIRPVLFKTYDLSEAVTALRDVTSRKSYGKAILKIS
ncbi:MAG: NADPH:quinone oxidoreductase family protein [Leptospiraceae bacterium]|nr:NADPH:quinone oxidoreductase family protein [Leptospiraceae bacterium]MCP5510331.1 NADPH:quinone oxidoreductase family protein [Leptospiraceae bacterium]